MLEAETKSHKRPMEHLGVDENPQTFPARVLASGESIAWPATDIQRVGEMRKRYK